MASNPCSRRPCAPPPCNVTVTTRVGPTGPIGPIGPTGTFVANAIMFTTINTGPYTNGDAILDWVAGPSTASAPVTTNGITFTAVTAGLYQVFWSFEGTLNGVSSSATVGAVLFNDDTLTPISASDAANTWTIGEQTKISQSFLVNLIAGTIMQLQVTIQPSGNSITLNTGATGVAARIYFVKLA